MGNDNYGESEVILKAVSLPHGQLPGSLELAYLGDTIYDLYVRARLLSKGGKVAALHREAVKKVNAHAQSEALARVESILSEEEKDVVRRARNADQVAPSRADPADYRRATGLEALIGYLALTGRTDRLDEVMRAALAGEN